MIHAGEATNVIPDSCELQGTVRAFRGEVQDLIEQRMKRIAEHTCQAHDAVCEFEFHRNYPPTVNSAAEAEFARKVMASIVGADNVAVQEPTMGAEDFAFMLQARPGAYCFIANGDGDHRAMGTARALHAAQPQLRLQRRPDPLGATYWCGWPRNGSRRIRMSGVHGISRSYAEARQKFLPPPTPPAWRSRPSRIRSPDCTARRWRWTWPAPALRRIPAADPSSACHGVEGYCGSGVQVAALRDAELARARPRPRRGCAVHPRAQSLRLLAPPARPTRTWT